MKVATSGLLIGEENKATLVWVDLNLSLKLMRQSLKVENLLVGERRAKLDISLLVKLARQ